MLHELGANRLLDLVESGERLIALLLDLDDVPAELGLHRLRDLADLKRESCILERLQHLAAGKKAKVAAFGAGVFRLLLGDHGKILALLQPLGDLFGLGLSRHQNVAGMDLLLGLHAADLLVIDLLGSVVSYGIADARIEERVAQRAPLMIFEAGGKIRGAVEFVLFARLRHELVLDDILQEHAPAVRRCVVGEP